MNARTIGRHTVIQVTSFYPPHIGGVENVAQTLAELLAERHDVHVVTTTCGAQDAPVRENSKRVRIRRFSGVALAHTPISFGLALRLLTLGRHSIIHVHIAQAFVPEVVLVASIIRRLRYIAHFHLDVEPSGRLGFLLAGYKRWILKPFLQRATAVVALSTEQATFLESHYALEHDRITVIPNGVDPRFYPRPGPPGPSTASSQSFKLLFVGRLDEQKNVPRLVDAMSYVTSPVELVIVGDGELRDEIADRIAALGLRNVTLAGAARGDELVRWYRWADAFVLPSDKEGMPLVLLEAMAAGLPIVATDVPGTRQLVDGVGLLVEPNPRSLAAGIDAIAEDPALLATLAARSATRGREFRWEVGVSALERLYNSVVA
jgi:glycosyltransferase involved in cell wall biosynthesis